MIVCICGSLGIRALPAAAIQHLEAILELGASVVIGDAPGADTLAQNFLAGRGCTGVTVWHTGAAPRNNVGGWPVRRVRGGYTERDQAMCAAADRGLALWDGRSPGTARNIRQMGARMRVVRA